MPLNPPNKIFPDALPPIGLGDAKGFESFLKASGDHIYSFVYGIVGDESLAFDVLRESLRDCLLPDAAKASECTLHSLVLRARTRAMTGRLKRAEPQTELLPTVQHGQSEIVQAWSTLSELERLSLAASFFRGMNASDLSQLAGEPAEKIRAAMRTGLRLFAMTVFDPSRMKPALLNSLYVEELLVLRALGLAERVDEEEIARITPNIANDISAWQEIFSEAVVSLILLCRPMVLNETMHAMMCDDYNKMQANVPA
jgi:DNA-directed RNA polymerase specialized sigma24 family protein